MEIDNSNTFQTDLWQPRYLFKRYDSTSGGSSNSSRNSSLTSGSAASFPQSTRRKNAQTGRRIRTISDNYTVSNGSRTTTRRGGQEESKNENTSSDFENDKENEDTCLFCTSMDHERQYYLWQSQYTRSSLCTRCTDDNEGMRYISYWGTPEYKVGSWRKRYNAGRSTDIDLTPLLEVLERIDKIDTSAYGRNRNNYQYRGSEYEVNDDKEHILKEKSTDQSNYLMTRRRRRRANRKLLENISDINMNTVTDETNLSMEQADNNNNNIESIYAKKDRTHVTDTENEHTKAESESENCYNNEDVGIIEPIDVQTVEEKEEEVKKTSKTFNSPTCTTDLTIEPNNENQKSCKDEQSFSERLARYRRQRRKSNYEDFIAGIDTCELLKRRSTADKDLKNICKASANCKVANSNAMTTHPRSKDKEIDVETANDCINRSCEDKADANIDKVLKYKSVKKKRSSFVKSTSLASDNESDSDGSLRDAPVYNRRRRPSKMQDRHSNIRIYISSNDESDSEIRTVRSIKRKFEAAEKEKCSDSATVTASSSDRISRGTFRNKYLNVAIHGQNVDLDIEETKFCGSEVTDNEDSYDEESNVNEYDETDWSNTTESTSVRDNTTTFEVNVSETQNTADGNYSSLENCRQTSSNANYQNDDKVNRNMGTDNLPIEEDCSTNNKTRCAPKMPEYVTKCSEIRTVFDRQTCKPTQQEEKCQSDDECITSIENSSSTEKKPDISDNKIGTLCFNEHTIDNNNYCNTNLMSNTANSSNINSNVLTRREKTEYRDRESRFSKDNEISNEHENPTIERIKRKLKGKPKECDDEDASELQDSILELDGSDNEQIELGWRSRGYSADFYMSRQSHTGSEILARYKRALSNRRSRKSLRDTSKDERKQSVFADVLTHSEPVTRRCSRNMQTETSASDPVTRSQTMLDMDKQNGEFQVRSHGDTNETQGVSPVELTFALNRAAACSKRMSQRLATQIEHRDFNNSFD